MWLNNMSINFNKMFRYISSQFHIKYIANNTSSNVRSKFSTNIKTEISTLMNIYDIGDFIFLEIVQWE